MPEHKPSGQDANPHQQCPLQGITQSHLQQFMVSAWLHFFRQPSEADTCWKECNRRRRRNFADAGHGEVSNFVSYIATQAPESQRAQLVATVYSRRG